MEYTMQAALPKPTCCSELTLREGLTTLIQGLSSRNGSSAVAKPTVPVLPIAPADVHLHYMLSLKQLLCSPIWAVQHLCHDAESADKRQSNICMIA